MEQMREEVVSWAALPIPGFPAVRLRVAAWPSLPRVRSPERGQLESRDGLASWGPQHGARLGTCLPEAGAWPWSPSSRAFFLSKSHNGPEVGW